ncbi:FAD-dependent oxidoreductase [Croceicoccus sp. BE223]|uniref:oxidoreductase n=1 Tax=Croceicoccus sp. BE223 TaxID=2817716 RepID=UPI0028574456|nr:FAD-dependent oxidoreductase [Croceicoccus sp. BE223]MDR7103794.1 2,4-dienoyl-CoA reductase-like NADH-dependent reductase (Old Yellow Enzyme family) [Croceicoccus sp. BE223]
MKLLEPIRLGPVEVRNRVVSTAHAAYLDFFQPGSNGERYIAYQERRAEGGAGMVVLTAMHVHESSGLLNHFNYEEGDMARKFRELSRRLHAHGTTAISQLFHYGMQSISSVRPDLHPLWGWSQRVNSEGEIGHAMTDAEVETVIEAFCRTAQIAVENGMDGVELHGTHGYLIQQSFTPMFNRRTDRWGDPLAFTTELARRVRAAIGPDKVLGFRTSADDLVPPEKGGVGPDKCREYTVEFVRTGVFDYLNHSEGQGGSHYAQAIGSYRHKFGRWLPLTRALRDAINATIPVIGVGRIPTPDLAEGALQAGDCDMVGMTRAQIADPDLVRKLMTGQGARIRTCTGANQGCIDRARYPITCFQNPEVGEENRLRRMDAVPTEPKHVLVVGGGPAGMKAAEIAARRGHRVVLAEGGPVLGGRLNMVGAMGAASNLLSATAWIEQEMADLPVEVRLQTVVDADYIRAEAPDAIILATGAQPQGGLTCRDDGSIVVLSSDEAARGEYEGQRFDMAGTRALMVDLRGSYESALVLESLVDRGATVTVVTPFQVFGPNLGFTHMNDLLARMLRAGTRLLTMSKLVEVAQGEATVVHAASGERTRASYDFIVSGAPPRSNDMLRAECEGIAPTFLAGDVISPRSALEAIREGDRVARRI